MTSEDLLAPGTWLRVLPEGVHLVEAPTLHDYLLLQETGPSNAVPVDTEYLVIDRRKLRDPIRQSTRMRLVMVSAAGRKVEINLDLVWKALEVARRV